MEFVFLQVLVKRLLACNSNFLSVALAVMYGCRTVLAEFWHWNKWVRPSVDLAFNFDVDFVHNSKESY